MKKIIIFMLLACMAASGMFVQHKQQLQDGLYLVDKVLYDTNSITLKQNQMQVHFNHGFLESAPGNSTGLLVNTADFVPLLLQEEPLLVPQTDTSGKVQITFSRPAAEKLERFTAENVMKQAALVVNGEAITVNKIRDTIHGGKMEITGSSANACRRMYAVLKGHNVQRVK